MKAIRIGIIGIGNMGTQHARYLRAGTVRDAELIAVCDINPARREWARQNFPGIEVFETADDLFKHPNLDGVIIAVPHYGHPDLAQTALQQDLHVLIEKPAGVFTKAVRQMNRAAKESGRVFSIMYNQRANPLYQKLRDLIHSGELGPIRRTNWIITSWYRSQSYYDSGDWRATWAGEGGGVLINQDPHQLDLWQWTTGLMPIRVRAFCGFGKYHNIEVEDDVTAFVEYENGGTGVFVTSTAEAPGTNRFEIVGDRGKIVIENGQMTFWRLRMSEREFNRTYRGGFGQPEAWECRVPVVGQEGNHQAITQNWVDAIIHGCALIAPGEEGIAGLEISNAMHLSAWLNDWVSIPVDEDVYWTELQKRIATSKRHQHKMNLHLDVDGTF